MSGLQQQQQQELRQQQVTVKMEPSGPSSPVTAMAAAIHNNLVVRVDQNSETDLQALFDSVLKPDGKKPLQLPYRMRQLPKSFFNPPSTGSKSPSVSHSRENSADSTFGQHQPCGVPVPSHSRAHSSPALLQQTYAAGLAKQQHQQHKHAKTHSYDVSTAIDELGPLPPGWEQAHTAEGQVYYLNHHTRTTHWEDPRKSLAAQTASQHQRSAEQLLNPGNDSGSSTNTTSTPTNSPPHIQTTIQTSNKNVTLGPLPDEWEKARTVDGETYFINHLTRTTSWFDPRIPAHLQRAPTSGAVLPSGAASWPQNVSVLAHSIQVSQQELRLHKLQMERERLKIRQQEIIRQDPKMQTVRPAQTNDLDPFLPCNNNVDHSRQESADSGLGMGNNYSLPHTPEDFLSSNMDDNMDCTSDCDTPGPSNMSVVDSQEMASLDAADELVPSLQIGDEFSSDILDEVQSLIDPANKPGSILTWL